MFTLENLLQTDQRPAPYDPGAEFWNDPYISQQLLKAHLAPDTDQASYRPETLDAICGYLPGAMGLSPGCAVADLGCGPGLYCARLSDMGYAVTGVDRSENSLAYAREHAPKARFLRQSYLEPFGERVFDAAVMISQDYGVLSPEQRKLLLQNIRAALKPGGYFAFDAPSPQAMKDRAAANAPNWYAAEGGLFRPEAHFVLQKALLYPELCALCDTYSVLDTQITTYRFWQTFFSPEAIGAELYENGFRVTAVLSDLAGKAYAGDSAALGVICQKA